MTSGMSARKILPSFNTHKQIRRPGYVRTPVPFSCSAKRKVPKRTPPRYHARCARTLCCLLDLGGCGTRTMRPRAPTCSNSPRRNPRGQASCSARHRGPKCVERRAAVQCAALIAPKFVTQYCVDSRWVPGQELRTCSICMATECYTVFGHIEAIRKGPLRHRPKITPRSGDC